MAVQQSGQGGKRMLLISSNSILAEGLRGIVGGDLRFGSLTVVHSPADLWDAHRRIQADVVVIDFRTLERVLPMLWRFWGTPMVLMLLDAEMTRPDSNLLPGMTVLRSDLAPTLLLSELRKVAGLSGEPWGIPNERPAMIQSGGLSRRETDTLREVALGKSNKEISDCLGISTETVKFHLKNAQSKLGASNRVSAVIEAIRRRLIELPAEMR